MERRRTTAVGIFSHQTDKTWPRTWPTLLSLARPEGRKIDTVTDIIGWSLYVQTLRSIFCCSMNPCLTALLFLVYNQRSHFTPTISLSASKNCFLPILNELSYIVSRAECLLLKTYWRVVLCTAYALYSALRLRSDTFLNSKWFIICLTFTIAYTAKYSQSCFTDHLTVYIETTCI